MGFAHSRFAARVLVNTIAWIRRPHALLDANVPGIRIDRRSPGFYRHRNCGRGNREAPIFHFSGVLRDLTRHPSLAPRQRCLSVELPGSDSLMPAKSLPSLMEKAQISQAYAGSERRKL